MRIGALRASLAAPVFVLGLGGCNSCSNKHSASGNNTTAEGRPPAPVHDPDLEVIATDSLDGGGRLLTSSDLALSDNEIFWLDPTSKRVLARAKTGGDARVVLEHVRIEGIGSARDGVFVAEHAGTWRIRVVHVATGGRRLELGEIPARFFAIASFGDGVYVRGDSGITRMKLGEPPRLLASVDVATALTACPFGATWLATTVASDASLEQLSDAKMQRVSSIVVYRDSGNGVGAVTTLVSSLVENNVGDLACDAESVFWTDPAGIHRILASGNGDGVILAKPPSTRKLAVVGDALYFGTTRGIDRIFLRARNDVDDAGPFAQRVFTRDDAQPSSRPLADATHVYWTTHQDVRRKRR